MKIYEAMTAETEKCLSSEAEGRISADYVYAYPPDIPIVVPGEVISGTAISDVNKMIRQGITIIGIDEGFISCVK